MRRARPRFDHVLADLGERHRSGRGEHIGAGAETSQAESATLTAPTTAGTYYVWVIADDLGTVTNQSDTTNDPQPSVAFTVTSPPPPPPPPPLTYSLSPNPASVDDNAGQLTFTITRSDSSGPGVVHVRTVQDQGFTNNGDYTDLNGDEVNFAPGVSTAQVSVAITDTGATSGSEVFRLIVQQNRRDPVSTYLATDNFTITNTGVSPPPPPPSGSNAAQQSPAVLNDFSWAQGWGSPNNPRIIADVNGDGTSDYVGFGDSFTFIAYGGTFSNAQGSTGPGFFGGNRGGTGFREQRRLHR